MRNHLGEQQRSAIVPLDIDSRLELAVKKRKSQNSSMMKILMKRMIKQKIPMTTKKQTKSDIVLEETLNILIDMITFDQEKRPILF